MHINEQIKHAIELHKQITQPKNGSIKRSDVHLLVRSLIPCQSKDEVISLIELWSEKTDSDSKESVFTQASVDEEKFLGLITTINNKLIQNKEISLHESKEIIGLMTRLF